MESHLVRRDQFNVSPQGIIHKPTDAAFTPRFGDPRSGTIRLGTLGNKHPNGNGYRSDDVERMMRELSAEYVAAQPQRCLKGSLHSASRSASPKPFDTSTAAQ